MTGRRRSRAVAILMAGIFAAGVAGAADLGRVLPGLEQESLQQRFERRARHPGAEHARRRGRRQDLRRPAAAMALPAPLARPGDRPPAPRRRAGDRLRRAVHRADDGARRQRAHRRRRPRAQRRPRHRGDRRARRHQRARRCRDAQEHRRAGGGEQPARGPRRGPAARRVRARRPADAGHRRRAARRATRRPRRRSRRAAPGSTSTARRAPSTPSRSPTWSTGASIPRACAGGWSSSARRRRRCRTSIPRRRATGYVGARDRGQRDRHASSAATRCAGRRPGSAC